MQKRNRQRITLGMVMMIMLNPVVMPTAYAQLATHQQVSMTTLTPQQLESLVEISSQMVIMQARQQGISEDKIAELQSRLDGMMQQAKQLIAQQSQHGSIQIPTSALQMLTSQGQHTGTQMQAQSEGINLPELPSFLGDGGMDTLIDYLISGLADALTLIPVVGPPLSKIVKGIGVGLREFLVNNALAGEILGNLNGAREYYENLQQILSYTDLNKLLDGGSNLVAGRLNDLLGNYGGKTVMADPSNPADIRRAIKEAQKSTLAGLDQVYDRYQKDPYKELTGVSKYSSPMTAVSEVTSMMGHYEAAKLTNKGVRATGDSILAQANGDALVQKTTENVGLAIKHGQTARSGAAKATTALGAMKIQTGLIAEANNLNAMNSAAIVGTMRQVLSAQDATTQVTAALLDQQIKRRKEVAALAQRQSKDLATSNIETATSAAAAVASLQHIGKLGKIDASKHPMPGPYGEKSFLK